MTNTCYTSVNISGDAAELENLDDNLAEALAVPDSGNESWIGNLWLHMGLGPEAAASGELGKSRGKITGHALKDGVLSVEVESDWLPRLKPLHDFMRRYAPSAGMLVFASEPVEGLYATSGADDTYAAVLPDRTAPLPRELAGWTSIWEQCDLLGEMALKLGMDEAGGFDAVAKAFSEKYPVQVAKYVHVDAGQYLK